MKKLEIREDIFMAGFGNDDSYQNDGTDLFLDKETGEDFFVGDSNSQCDCPMVLNDWASNRAMINKNPEKYLQISSTPHSDHHDILCEFLDSDWTSDKELAKRVKDLYFGSIGGWKKQVDDIFHSYDIFHSFEDFRYHRLLDRGTEFLRENGIDPVWS